MRLALLCTHWERIGGSERYALWLAEELARAGHELVIAHETGTPAPIEGARFVARPSARALRGELARARIERVLVLTPCRAELWGELARAAPIVRWVQDHTFFCPARNKLLASGAPCTRPMGRACVEEALGAGCHGFEGAGAAARVARVARLVGRLARTEAELARGRRSARLVVASAWMRAELVRLGVEPERVALVPYPAMVRAGAGGAAGDVPDAVERRAAAECDGRGDGARRADAAAPAAPAARIDHALAPERALATATASASARASAAGSGTARAGASAADREQPIAARPGRPGWVGAVVGGPGEDATEPPLVLAAARLAHPDKGIDHLLTALTQVTLPYRAIVAGDGPARAWLASKAAAEGLADRVRFAGWLDGDALGGLYARARLVAFPSVWDEPFGLVGLEAMTHARPVVAFDVGGVREWLVPGRTGLVVPRRDTAALAAAIDRLLADPALAARLGRAGAELARERFAPAIHLRRITAVLESARA